MVLLYCNYSIKGKGYTHSWRPDTGTRCTACLGREFSGLDMCGVPVAGDAIWGDVGYVVWKWALTPPNSHFHFHFHFSNMLLNEDEMGLCQKGVLVLYPWNLYYLHYRFDDFGGPYSWRNRSLQNASASDAAGAGGAIPDLHRLVWIQKSQWFPLVVPVQTNGKDVSGRGYTRNHWTFGQGWAPKVSDVPEKWIIDI
jgi:hypothetical protein